MLEESRLHRRCGRPTRRPDAPGRLENLKELVKALAEFENLQGFLEHVALVMDNDARAERDKVQS